MNEPENPDRPETPERAGTGDRVEGADPAATEDRPMADGSMESVRSADGAPSTEEDSSTSEQPENDITSMYVRRRRTPTLGFWVAVAIIVPSVAALLISPLFAFTDISGVLNFMLVVAVFVGLPLAAIACVIDAVRHRTPKRPRR